MTTVLPRPTDDLFRHVNGEWLAHTDIPADHSLWGAFYELRELSEKRCLDLIEACEESEGGEAGLIARLWHDFLDTDTIEARGLTDLVRDWERIEAAETKTDLAALLGQLERDGVGGWVGLTIGTDPHDPTHTCPMFYPAGLSLPDEVYYHAPEYQQVRQQFLAHVRRMASLAGWANPAKAAAQVFEVERGFARHHLDAVRSRNLDLTVNLCDYDDVRADATGFAWDAWTQALGASLGRVNATWPSFLVAGARWWSLVPIDALRTWLAWRVLTRYATYLPAAFVEEDFDFYSRQLAGTAQMKERWRRGVSVIESHLGFALGKAYVTAHFPESSRDQMLRLVETLLVAYGRSIAQLEWMSDETKARAAEKLATFRTKIGYPTTPRTYDIAFTPDMSLIDLVRASSQASTDFEVAKIGQEVDREEWFMTPQTVNAYYNPAANEIVFPAAILEEPFYSPNATDAQNYGGIGAVIGHEIGHGFDDQGAKRDGTGAVMNWWTDADFAEFSARTRALIDQYNQFVPEGLSADEHVNGELTIGENIGDLGGLSIALKAWHIAREDDGLPAPTDEETREFFTQWARVWRGKARPEMARQLLVIDPHSPSEFRCNGVVRNIDAFHDAFGTKPGDGLWLDPADRVSIW